MSDKQKRVARRTQQAVEVEASQANMRANIKEAKRLVDESDRMIRRHRKERDDDEAAESEPED